MVTTVSRVRAAGVCSPLFCRAHNRLAEDDKRLSTPAWDMRDVALHVHEFEATSKELLRRLSGKSLDADQDVRLPMLRFDQGSRLDPFKYEIASKHELPPVVWLRVREKRLNLHSRNGARHFTKFARLETWSANDGGALLRPSWWHWHGRRWSYLTVRAGGNDRKNSATDLDCAALQCHA